MPLAQCPGGVARTFLEEPRHEAVLEVDATRDARHRVEVHVRLLAEVPGVAAREDLRARRAAEPVDVVLVEDDGLGAKLVQLRCADLAEAVMPAHVVPAQVVHEREDDVGPLCRRGLAAEGCGQRSCEDDDGLRCGRLRCWQHLSFVGSAAGTAAGLQEEGGTRGGGVKAAFLCALYNLQINCLAPASPTTYSLFWHMNTHTRVGCRLDGHRPYYTDMR